MSNKKIVSYKLGYTISVPMYLLLLGMLESVGAQRCFPRQNPDGSEVMICDPTPTPIPAATETPDPNKIDYVDEYGNRHTILENGVTGMTPPSITRTPANAHELAVDMFPGEEPPQDWENNPEFLAERIGK